MEIFEEQNALWVLEDTDIYKYRLIELWQNNILLFNAEIKNKNNIIDINIPLK